MTGLGWRSGLRDVVTLRDAGRVMPAAGRMPGVRRDERECLWLQGFSGSLLVEEGVLRSVFVPGASRVFVPCFAFPGHPRVRGGG